MRDSNMAFPGVILIFLLSLFFLSILSATVDATMDAIDYFILWLLGYSMSIIVLLVFVATYKLIKDLPKVIK